MASEQNVYCGPVTVGEIRKMLSMEKPVDSIKRRHSIGDLEPSREIRTYPLTSEDFFIEDDEVEVSFLSEYFSARESTVESNPVENITIQSSDTSSISDHFNDTIEEMERLLQNADIENVNNYSLPKQDISHDSSISELESFGYPSFDVENMMDQEDKIVPVTKQTKVIHHFKTPKMPSKLPKQINFIRNPTPKVNLLTSPNYKNVVSPVAMYIKHSVRTPIKHNVPAKQLPLRHINAGTPTNKFTNSEEFLLPTVTYKPTKTVVVSHETGQKLPESIKKYIPTQPEVIKHNGRMLNQNVIAPEEKILMEDLTLMNSTLLQTSSQDISILAIKNAFQ